MISLILSSCASTANTGKDGSYVYGIGEKIEIFDNDSEKKLGEVTVTDVFVLSDESFRLEVSEGDSVLFGGLVQICYTADVIDSSNPVDEHSFVVRDCEGNDAEIDPDVEYEMKETSDKAFVCAVEELGEGVKIGLSFHRFQPVIAWVDGNYEKAEDLRDNYVSNENNEEPEERDDGKVKLLTVICIAEGVVLLGAIITILVLVTKKRI